MLKRKKPLLEEMVTKVHDYERKNMDVYVLDDPTLTRDVVLIFRRDKSGDYNNVSSLEIKRLRKKIQHYEEEIIKLQEKIYPRGTEAELSPKERYARRHPKGAGRGARESRGGRGSSVAGRRRRHRGRPAGARRGDRGVRRVAVVRPCRGRASRPRHPLRLPGSVGWNPAEVQPDQAPRSYL